MSHVRINLKCSPCVILTVLNQEATGRGEITKCCRCTDGTGNHCKPLACVWNSIAECWNTMLLRPVGLLPPTNSSTVVSGETGNASDLVRHHRGELNTVILVSRLCTSICNCVVLLLFRSDLESKMLLWCSSSEGVHFIERALLTSSGGGLSSTLQ